jgi:surface-anchored protein
MNTLTKLKLRRLSLALLVASGSALTAQEIEFSGGTADLTIFYDSTENTFATVFRGKGNTVASGLTDLYGNPPGGVGGSSDDYVFSELTVTLNGAPIFEVDDHNYFVSSASGGFFEDPAIPDLGIRTRLREGDPAIQQFETLRWTLNLSNSIMPADGEFILFGAPALGEEPVILIDTEHGDLSYDWPNYGHSHWHWGFSKHGEYKLTFDMEGQGGEYGDAEATGSFAINFSVNPANWFGYPIGEDYIVETSSGDLYYVEHRPWVYSYDLRKYVFMPEAAYTETGSWLFVPRQEP